MPGKGYMSITITSMIYDDLKLVYKKNELELARMGIRSLSGLFDYAVYDWLNANDMISKRRGLVLKKPSKGTS